jgi:protein-S-isoprenylcysteine O-methyltransferase Ste14
MPPYSAPEENGWRTRVFKNRGLLLVPVALVLVLLGSPSFRSAVVGTAVAALGELIRIWAVGYSGVTTRSDVVTAPKLVTAGPYSFVRNPLYVGNAIIALGFWLAFSGNVSPGVSIGMFAAIAILVVAVYATIIPLEESYLSSTFGAEYDSYRRAVPSVIPVATPLSRDVRQGAWHGDVIMRAEIITLVYFALMVLAVILKLWAAKQDTV